ncbi:2452_t:CDS:2, partial [Gigaspora rosea]
EPQPRTKQTDQHDNAQQNVRENKWTQLCLITAIETESNTMIEEINELQDDPPKKKIYSEALRNQDEPGSDICQLEKKNRNRFPKGGFAKISIKISFEQTRRKIRAANNNDLLPLPDLLELIPEKIKQVLLFDLSIESWRDTGQIAKALRIIFTFEKLPDEHFAN